MNKSESIGNLAKSLALFQGEVVNPKNTANNPFFKSKYCPLQDILSLTRPLLTKHGLSVLQYPSGDGKNIIITTILMHSSGEWIETEPLVLQADKATAQGAGSAITYGRRYALSAILGISSEDDDDGNGATHGDSGTKNEVTKPTKSNQTTTKTPQQQQPLKQADPPQTQQTKALPVNWPSFWATMKDLGFTQQQVHEHAKVESIAHYTREQANALFVEMSGLNKHLGEGA